MASVNFIKVAEYIFLNKSMYSTLTDEDKVNTFFILNKKFSNGHPRIAQFLNRKGLDRASALDYWFMHFSGTNQVPGYFYNPSAQKDVVKVKNRKLSQEDLDILLEYFDVSEDNAEFLAEYFREDIDNEINKIKRFKNKEK